MSVQPDGDASVAGLQSLEQGDSGEQQQQPAGVQINCIEKIDALFYCSSVGYQLKHYYQYGRPRMCSDKWEDVKMCFRVKTSKPEVGQTIYDEYMAAKEASKPVYTPVWELRDHPPENFPPA